MSANTKYIIIGGSAGSFQSVITILEALPKKYPHTILLILHRLKHIRKGFAETLSLRTKILLLEPYDKAPVKPAHVYIAPANYHLYIRANNTFMLSTEETVKHSRPSIDIAFASAAKQWKNNLTGVLFSGANSDGATGMKKIEEYNGNILIQTPEECQISTMTERAIMKTQNPKIMTSNEIKNYIINL